MNNLSYAKKYASLCLALLFLAPNAALAHDGGHKAEGEKKVKTAEKAQAVADAIPTDTEIMAKQDSSILMSINGVEIQKWMYDNGLRDGLIKAKREKKEAIDENSIKKEVLQNLIDMEVLYQEAKRQDLLVNTAGGHFRSTIIGARYKKPGEFKKVLAAAGMTENQYAGIWQQQASVNQLLTEKILKAVEVSEGELVARYEQDKDTFTRKPKIQASHILLMVEKDATEEQKAHVKKQIEELHTQILAGKDFAELAKGHSQDGTAKLGGNLGFFSKEEMVKPFANAAFALKIGEVSPVIETQFGYHIIKKTGEQDAVPSLDEMRAELATTIKNEKGRHSFIKFKEDLTKKANIEFKDKTLEEVYHAR